MTAIKPIENRRVRAIASERYPLNKVCAHPECVEPADDPHHAFPRSAIGGSSWFVEIEGSQVGTFGDEAHLTVIPHVTGLCRAHHEVAERRDAWIRYDEVDKEWSWWDRDESEGATQLDWIELGVLNPQPGSAEGKPKRRKKLAGEQRRKRRTISIKVPNDTEDGGALWDEMWEGVQERLIAAGLYDESNHIPVYEGIMAALHDWLQS